MDKIEITINDKYTFLYIPGKELSCRRYDEPWIKEFTIGSNAIVGLIMEVEELRKIIPAMLTRIEANTHPAYLNDATWSPAEIIEMIQEIKEQLG